MTTGGRTRYGSGLLLLSRIKRFDYLNRYNVKPHRRLYLRGMNQSDIGVDSLTISDNNRLLRFLRLQRRELGPGIYIVVIDGMSHKVVIR